MELTLLNGIKIKIMKALYEDLYNFCYQIVNQNMDLVIIIDGKEGVGKSFTGRGVGAIIATIVQELTGEKQQFDVENIHFDLEEYLKSSIYGKPYQVNILDESRKVANKLRTNSKETVSFTNYLSECRKKRQIHVIILPAYHDLTKYLILWRVNIVIHLKRMYEEIEKDNKKIIALERGYYSVFSDKKQIHIYYKKPYEYPSRVDYSGYWANTDGLTKEQVNEYEEKKDRYTVIKYDPDNANKEEIKEELFSIEDFSLISGLTIEKVVGLIKNKTLEGEETEQGWKLRRGDLYKVREGVEKL